MTGDRPAHLDRCDICASRVVELGRWLEGVRLTNEAIVDAAFPPEKLAAQQHQIMRRLEQLDQPTRVISFPSQYKFDERPTGARRIAPAWAVLTAAAGLLVGAVGGQVTARMAMKPVAAPQPETMTVSAPEPAPTVTAAQRTSLAQHDEEVRRPSVSALEAMDENSPHLLPDSAEFIRASYPGPVKSGGR